MALHPVWRNIVAACPCATASSGSPAQQENVPILYMVIKEDRIKATVESLSRKRETAGFQVILNII